MSVRSVWVAASGLVVGGMVLMNGCQPQGLAPVPSEGGGGGDFVTPAPDPNLGAERVPASPDPAGTPVLLPPIQAPSASPFGSAAPTASPAAGTSPAPFPAVSPPPSPGVGTAGGA
jgi:hypothetical protein